MSAHSVLVSHKRMVPNLTLGQGVLLPKTLLSSFSPMNCGGTVWAAPKMLKNIRPTSNKAAFFTVRPFLFAVSGVNRLTVARAEPASRSPLFGSQTDPLRFVGQIYC